MNYWVNNIIFIESPTLYLSVYPVFSPISIFFENLNFYIMKTANITVWKYCGVCLKLDYTLRCLEYICSESSRLQMYTNFYILANLSTSFSYTFCNFDNHVSHWESSSLKYKISRLTCLELRFWYFSKASLGSDPSSLIFFIHSSFCYKKNPTPFQNLNIIILTCENVKIPRFLLLTINPCLYIIIFLKFFLVVSSYIQCRVPASGFKKKIPKKVQFKLLDLFSL